MARTTSVSRAHGPTAAGDGQDYGRQLCGGQPRSLAEGGDAGLVVEGGVGLHELFGDCWVSAAIAGLGQCPHRLFDVEADALQVLVVARESRGQDAVGGDDEIGQHGLGDKLFINGQGQGLTYIDVVEGGHLGIETEVADAVIGGCNLQVPVGSPSVGSRTRSMSARPTPVKSISLFSYMVIPTPPLRRRLTASRWAGSL